MKPVAVVQVEQLEILSHQQMPDPKVLLAIALYSQTGKSHSERFRRSLRFGPGGKVPYQNNTNKLVYTTSLNNASVIHQEPKFWP